MIANDTLPCVFYIFRVFYLSFLETGLVEIVFVIVLSGKTVFCLPRVDMASSGS